MHKAIDKVDLTQTSAMMLEGLTRDNRHQKLLDSLINQLIALLQRDSSAPLSPAASYTGWRPNTR